MAGKSTRVEGGELFAVSIAATLLVNPLVVGMGLHLVKWRPMGMNLIVN